MVLWGPCKVPWTVRGDKLFCHRWSAGTTFGGDRLWYDSSMNASTFVMKKFETQKRGCKKSLGKRSRDFGFVGLQPHTFKKINSLNLSYWFGRRERYRLSCRGGAGSSVCHHLNIRYSIQEGNYTPITKPILHG